MSGDDTYNNLGSIPLTPSQYYQHLALNIKPEHLDGSQYVFAGDEKKKRPLNDIMFFGIGSSYLSGLIIGSVWGLLEHRRTFDESSKILRRNHCLNSVTKRGTFMGNSIAVLALLYTASTGLLGKFRDKDDLWNDVGGGAVTGTLYKCTRGAVQAGKFAGVGAICGLALNVVGGTWDQGSSYGPQVIRDTYEDLFDRNTT